MKEDRWREIDRYILDIFVPPDPVLEGALEAAAQAGLPPIHVAPNQGKLLEILARSVRARFILEIGTLAGYSTIWLGRALAPGGKLITLEANGRHADVAAQNIQRAGLGDVVEIRVGPALRSLADLEKSMSGLFDFIFVDADKKNNAAYFESALKLAHVGSLIVIDNVVRGGAVLRSDSGDERAQGARRGNSAMGENPRVLATAIQTVGSKGHDGFAIALVTDAGTMP